MTKKINYPRVSIVVVNWNGKKHLQYCLPSLKRLDYPDYEVIVVDNASADDSITYVKKNYPWIILIENQKNLGYVGGNNIGMDKARGDYILVLNNDMELTTDFLKIMVQTMEKDKKIGCLGPKLLSLQNKKLIDVMGSYFTDSGFLYHYGYLQKALSPLFNQKRPVFSAKGSCILLRKNALDKVGKFDDDYFIYFEETDLCHRLWLSGYKVIYEPGAVAYHYGAGDTGKEFTDERRIYLAIKNRLDSYIKNLEILNLFKILLATGLTSLVIFFLYLITLRWFQAWAIIRGFWWNIIHLPEIVKKRYRVQKLRKISDAVIFKSVKINPPLAYYYYMFTDLKNYHYEKLPHN